MISHRDKEGSDVHSKRRVSEFSNELLVSVMSSGLLPWWLSSKRIVLQCRRHGPVGSIPGSGRCPGEENGNPLQYSYLGNPMDRGALWATVHGVAKESDMIERLNINDNI